jgi:hypothetical protein
MPVYRRTQTWWQSNAQEGKGFGVQTSGSSGEVKETKRLEEQDEPVLVARHLIVHRRRTESFKANKGGLASVACGLGHRTN